MNDVARTPLTVDPADEGLHSPTDEPTWNESWYYDAVSPSGDFGVYVRLGRSPNRELSVFSAAVCGVGRPTVLVFDQSAPLPAEDDPLQTVSTEAFTYTQEYLEPLNLVRLKLTGTGRAFAGGPEVYADDSLGEVPVSFDLTWRTDGKPYQWRESTRYEIPCQVSGTVQIGEETVALTGPGQRDHSHGARDWWANEWVWRAMHYADGTHSHVVTIPPFPGYSVGYRQLDGQVQEISTGEGQRSGGEQWLPGHDVATTDVITETITPVAWAPLLMVNPDGGAVAHFSRALARGVREDGTTAVGWIEWNLLADD